MMVDILVLLISWMVKIIAAFLLGYTALAFVAAVAATLQESKIWKSPGIPTASWFGLLKMYCLNFVWMIVCLWGSAVVLLKSLLTGGSQTRSWAHEGVERWVAHMVIKLFVCPTVEIRGQEHLDAIPPSTKPAPVYIANHASQLDTAVVYALHRPFRWIAKSSVMALPGVGQIMYLSGHVFIDRAPKKKNGGVTSARNLYVQSNASVQEGTPMFFFPQGTRRMVERLPFKDGAYKVALANEAPLVPISIDVPPTAWNSAYPFSTKNVQPIVLTIHPAIPVHKDDDLQKLKEQTRDIIYSVLPDYQKTS